MTPVYQVDQVGRRFGRRRARTGDVQALDDISLTVAAGQRWGIVGQSGSGKTTLLRLLAGLDAPTAGRISFQGQPLRVDDKASLARLRAFVQLVFQDPRSSLDPRMRVGQIVAEPLRQRHGRWAGADGVGVDGAVSGERRAQVAGAGDPGTSASEVRMVVSGDPGASGPEARMAGAGDRRARVVVSGDRKARVAEVLAAVGLPGDAADRYPHEFSGGQRQRIAIARALAPGPQVLLADEPVSALDVAVRAQVLNLITDLVDQMGLTLIIVSHDLAVVRHLCDQVAVLNQGRIVESGPADRLYRDPSHPYTRSLLAAIPRLDHLMD
ncbi:MAG: ATP-binding cassette domain-containing protein [Propionibacteriaceae bacterium]|jgi:peptide/nickel transport system ATP-binding protein|nr:ATP-binding cassette domain-containing protein [Propionibacteriaceae bacterium]